MSGYALMLQDAVDRLLGDFCTPDLIRAAEAGAFPHELWRELHLMGLPLALAPEAAGGLAAGWADIFGLLRTAGRHSLPLPLAESMLSGWAAGTCGLPVGEAPTTIASLRSDETVGIEPDGNGWRLTGKLHRVPWGRDAAGILLFADGSAGPKAISVSPGAATAFRHGHNLAGEPRDDFTFENVWVSAERVAASTAQVSREVLYRRAALARALMMAGALEAILEMSVAHARTREQFGRPIANFQAIQHQLAVLATQVASAVAATGAAASALSGPDPGRESYLIAVAKICAGDAATLGSEIGHQVHGAIGFTREYALQFATRRLWSWREEFGAEREWAGRIGSAICARGAASLWPAIAEGALS